ncbi:MAG: hypothetical protein ABL982_08310 [Vicinamibacterales bacterium]
MKNKKKNPENRTLGPPTEARWSGVEAAERLRLQPRPVQPLRDGDLHAVWQEDGAVVPVAPPGDEDVARLLARARREAKKVLRLGLEVLSGAETTVPLPGSAAQWVPETVLLDGKASRIGLERRDAKRSASVGVVTCRCISAWSISSWVPATTHAWSRTPSQGNQS